MVFAEMKIVFSVLFFSADEQRALLGCEACA
jgi:hypothetical protein